jgi:DNA primase
MEKKGWVDFDKAKAVSFDLVIDAVGLREHLTPSGDELRGVCPIPAHTGSKEKDKFFINVGKGVFTCHQCKKKGNVLDFAMAYHDKPVKEAAAWLISLENSCNQAAEATATVQKEAELSEGNEDLLYSVEALVLNVLTELQKRPPLPIAKRIARLVVGMLREE